MRVPSRTRTCGAGVAVQCISQLCYRDIERKTGDPTTIPFGTNSFPVSDCTSQFHLPLNYIKVFSKLWVRFAIYPMPTLPINFELNIFIEYRYSKTLFSHYNSLSYYSFYVKHLKNTLHSSCISMACR